MYAKRVTESFDEDALPMDLPLETRCARFTIEPGVFEKLPGLHVVTALVLNAPNLDAEGWIKGHFDSVCKMVAGKKLEAKRGRLDVWKRYTSELKDRGSDNLFLTKGARREPTVQSMQSPPGPEGQELLGKPSGRLLQHPLRQARGHWRRLRLGSNARGSPVAAFQEG